MPVVTVDLNTTVSNQSATPYGGGAAVAAPGGQNNGDIHIEIYSDVTAYFIAAGGIWPAVANFTVARDLTTFAAATTASNNATGSGGSATTAARSDHKHAAQGVSADANNILSVSVTDVFMC